MLVFWCFLFSLFLIQPDAACRIRYVPHDYPKIQLAINASQTGDTVIVAPGLYYENLVIKKNIVLASYYLLSGDSSQISRTIIDGSRYRDEKLASTIYITGAADTNCIINGLTVRGGRGTFIRDPNDKFSIYSTCGGGINIVSAGAKIINSIIRDNHVMPADKNGYTYGGGIAVVDTSLLTIEQRKVIVESNIIISNSSSGKWAESGGVAVGIPAEIRSNIVMYNRTFSQGRAIGGGLGVYFITDYKILVEGNYICKNRAGLAGGFVIGSGSVRRGEARLVNNIIADNHSIEVGGAGNVAESVYAVFINNTVTGNTSQSKGGGINIASDAYAVFINNILWKNLPDQLSDWGLTQLNHNLIGGVLHGFGNIDSDPEFIPGDTLFRLSDHSPCISAGTRSVMLGREQVSAPIRDFAGSSRMIPANTDPDLGAMESTMGRKTEDEYSEHGGGYLRLYFNIRQAGKTERKQPTGELISAGRMECTMFVNEKGSRKISRDEIPSFELPPGKNHFDLEMTAYGRDSAMRISVFIWLEGEDNRVILHRKSDKIFYHYWANLKPGKYTLSIQPVDDESIIGGEVFRASITVPPFWYQRWWAYLLYTLTILSMAFVYTRLRVRNLEKEQALRLRTVELEKMSELDRMKSRFFANVTHELRTPLTLILGPAETLLKKKQSGESAEMLTLIKRNAARLLKLVEMLLQYSRLESGRMKLSAVKQNIVPVINRVAGYFSSPAARKNLKLSFSAASEDITGFFDEEKIELIVENLLSNSLKYTKSGDSVSVNISEEDSFLKIVISDTGIGISDEDQKHIFDRFFRVDSSHKTEGTGIGLSFTKELAELHHGNIAFTSKQGGGTTFTVTIPLGGYGDHEISNREPDQHFRTYEDTPVPAQSPHTSDDGEKQIILIAEDNSDTRIYIKSVLEKRYSVIETENGAAAVEQTKINLPDLIISDVMMPDMDGFELCREVKTDERSCHIPVILLTALAEKEEKMNGLHQGADDYLTKPFDADELLVRINNLLETRKKLRKAYSQKVKLKPGEIKVVSLDDRFLQRAMEVVEKHIADEKFSVDQFAHEVFLSRVQFYRKVKAVTDMAPADFIRVVRLERAHRLLEGNFGNIAEVSEAVGFSNQSYFTKCFHAHFGIQPHEVKKIQ